MVHATSVLALEFRSGEWASGATPVAAIAGSTPSVQVPNNHKLSQILSYMDPYL